MSISKNISKYRKAKGFTQEELGRILGVTNQAVSKWESAASMPDIMMLPQIACALDISIEQLYGIEKKDSAEKVKRSDFYENANRMLISLLYDQIGSWVLFPRVNAKNTPELAEAAKNPATGKIDKINEAKAFNLYSATSGFAYISNEMSVIVPEYDIFNAEEVFKNRETISVLKRFADPAVNKILSYMYAETFDEKKMYIKEAWNVEKEFAFEDMLQKCAVSEDDLEEGLDKLIMLKIIEKRTDKYVLYKPKLVQLAAILKPLGRFVHETHSWGWGGEDTLMCSYTEDID